MYYRVIIEILLLNSANLIIDCCYDWKCNINKSDIPHYNYL